MDLSSDVSLTCVLNRRAVHPSHMPVNDQHGSPWTLSGCWVMSGFFASSGQTSAKAIVSNVNIQEKEGENWNDEGGEGWFSDIVHVNMLTVGLQESEERG